MKTILASCRLQLSGRLNMVRTRGTPLPNQGEGEGEGLSKATRAGGATPHLNPLPFSEGRGEKIRLSDKSAIHSVLKTTSR
jgi:hypothetical protein